MTLKAESKPKNRLKMEATIHIEQAIHGGQRNNAVFKVQGDIRGMYQHLIQNIRRFH